jgi:hypothetical protein
MPIRLHAYTFVVAASLSSATRVVFAGHAGERVVHGYPAKSVLAAARGTRLKDGSFT